jgi:hypothetical protein
LSEHGNALSWFWESDLYQRLRVMSCIEEPNLLKLLFAVHDEVRLHTPLLGWLLDPQGSHGMGDEPLARFLATLDIDPANADRARVWRERSFPEYGRVDLMIQLPGCCVVIENKLYAADQEAQLWRYRQVLESQAAPAAKSYLFYLTLDGYEPPPISISAPAGSGDMAVLEEGGYRCISYEDEIRPWLIGLLEWTCHEQGKSRIHHILTQYNEILMEVIGVHSREEALRELKGSGLMDHITSNQGDIDALARLTRSVFFLHARLLEDLVGAVHEALESEPRLERVKSPSRWNELDWAIYEGWARGKAPSGYQFYRIVNVLDEALQGMHLVVGLDVGDGFWVGLGRFLEGKHVEGPDGSNRFADVEGGAHNNWWLHWVAIRELNPEQFDGDSGVGRLAIPERKVAVVEKVVAICRHYLKEIR